MPMLKVPTQLKKILGQLAAFFLVVSSTLFANWLWQKYTTKIDHKHEVEEERHFFLGVVRKVIEETEYNCLEGIGDHKCPFKLDAHHELLGVSLIDCLKKETADLAREIVRVGSLCNGGRTNRKVTPLLVKTKSAELKTLLHQLVDSEIAQIAH